MTKIVVSQLKCLVIFIFLMEQKFEQNVTFSFIYPLPAPLTPLPAIPFVLTKLKTVPLKHLKKLTKHQEILLLIFFISCFTVSVTPSINTYEFSSDFIISTISFISSFKRNKVNSLAPLTDPSALIIVLSNLFTAFQTYFLHLKLYYLLIQVNYLQPKEQLYLFVFFP